MKTAQRWPEAETLSLLEGVAEVDPLGLRVVDEKRLRASVMPGLLAKSATLDPARKADLVYALKELCVATYVVCAEIPATFSSFPTLPIDAATWNEVRKRLGRHIDQGLALPVLAASPGQNVLDFSLAALSAILSLPAYRGPLFLWAPEAHPEWGIFNSRPGGVVSETEDLQWTRERILSEATPPLGQFRF